MDDIKDLFDDASAIYKGDEKVVHIQLGNEVLYDEWPDCDINVQADEHVHGVESTTVPYGSPYHAELSVDAGYCISNVEIIMG